MYALHTDATQSPVASFNDSRCSADGVCSTDPLLFTCGLKDVLGLRVILPTGDHDVITVGHNTTHVALNLPHEFQAVFLNISEINDTRNIFLTLSILNASLLEGGEITCDDTIVNKIAGCPILGESQQRIEEKKNGDI